MSIFSNPASGSREHAQTYIEAVLELLEARNPMDILQETPLALRKGIDGLDATALRRPEAPGKWSIAHVLQHMADAEVVWGYRLRFILAHDRPSIVGYDQDLWAEALGYQDANADEALELFEVVRRSNLRLFMRLAPPALVRVGVHAERGEESVEHMIRLNAGHDLVHVRQVARIRGVIE